MSLYPQPQPRQLPPPIPALASRGVHTITDRLRARAEDNPEGVYFYQPQQDKQDDGGRYVAITNAQVWHYTLAFASHLATLLDLAAYERQPEQPCIALVGRGISLEYFLTLQALLALNCKVLLLSDRNAREVNDGLLAGAARGEMGQVAVVEAGCQAAITTQQDAAAGTKHVEMPQDYLAISADNEHAIRPWCDSTSGYGRGSYVLHTSGTTGAPQPVTMTHGQSLAICWAYNRSLDYLTPTSETQELLAPLLFPMYHAAGLNILGSRLTCILPERWPPSPKDLTQSWSKVGKVPDVLPIPASLLADLVAFLLDNDGDLAKLKPIREICPTGSLASPDVIAQLTAAGIVTRSTYGSSEGGLMLQTPQPTPEVPLPQWDGWKLVDYDGIRMVDVGPPSDSDERPCELILDHRWPCASDLWSPPTSLRSAITPQEFRVGDLFIERPRGSGIFYIQGRLDDMLVHSSGEKTNAIDVAAAIVSAGKGIIGAACVLGSNRPCPCALVQPPVGELARDPLWQQQALSAVRQANERLARYSRIPEELVLAVPLLPVTPKGSIRRNQAEKDHAEEIEKLYRDYEAGASSGKTGATARTVLDCVRIVLPHVTGDATTAESSLFDQGLDSISVHRLRNALNRLGGSTRGQSASITTLDIYDARSLRGLERLMARRAKQDNDMDRNARELEWMANRVSSEPRPQCIANGTDPSQIPPVVLLTGATGSLGAAIVQELVSRLPGVEVIALVRASDDTQAARRLSEAMIKYGHPASATNVRAIAYDPNDTAVALRRPDLAGVTTVLAVGWHVHFLHPLANFESQIDATLALQRFCTKDKHAPRALHFISSVSALMAAGHTIDRHERVDASRPQDASPMGYARSKWIVEALLESCDNVHIHRVGQIVGARGSAWTNRHEASAQLVDFSAQYRIWPSTLNDDRPVDWLPVDEVARHIVRQLQQSYRKFQVDNVTHPSPIRWSQLRGAIASSPSNVSKPLKDVPAEEWIARFTQDRGDALVGTLQGMLGLTDEASATFRTSLNESDVVPLQDDDVHAWIQGWRKD